MIETDFYRRNLPHWRQQEATYFVTWRLHPRQADLNDPEREMVSATLQHFDEERYRLWAFVVMNDHVHTLATPKDAHRLQDIVHSWKSFSAHRLQRQMGRSGAIWQDESFDRVVRDELELIEKARYIFNNPKKRCPEQGGYVWVGGRLNGLR